MPASQLPTVTCLVVNGDFETGNLLPWTNTGDTSFTGVDSNDPHFGSFSLETGPDTNDGFIDQVIPTVAGTAYDVSFWLENYDDTGNNRFGASFGGITLVPEASQGPFGYTLYTFNNVMPGANADLHFIFYNPNFFFYLDDVCVTVSGPSPTPTCPPVINEGFDNINNLPGWVMLNHSQPLGTTSWFQGDNSQFRAFDGFPTAYIAADFDNG